MEDGGETGEGHCPGRVGTPAAGVGEGAQHFRQWHWQDSRMWAVSERKESGGAMGDLVMLEPELSWG